MKNYDEEILKYLSGLMNSEEINNFEKKLESDLYLKAKFDKINNILTNFNSVKDSELNETYFNNLLPKVRNQLTGRKRRKLFKEYALIAPAVIIVLFAFYITLIDKKSEIDFTNSLTGEVIKNINDEELADNLLKDYSFESEINYLSNEGDLDIYIPENLNLSFNNISHYVDFSKLDYSQVDNMSGPELEKLYNNLSTINFEKVPK